MAIIKIRFYDRHGNYLDADYDTGETDKNEMPAWKAWYNDPAVEHYGAPELWNFFEVVYS